MSPVSGLTRPQTRRVTPPALPGSFEQQMLFEDKPKNSARPEVSAHDRRGYWVSHGMNRYEPRECRRRILDRLADLEWHDFIDLSSRVKMPTAGISHMLRLLVAWGVLDEAPMYFRPDGGCRLDHPGHGEGKYWGFSFGYRMKVEQQERIA